MPCHPTRHYGYRADFKLLNADVAPLKIKPIITFSLLGLLLSLGAEVIASERLDISGSPLTPMGAKRAGNTAGTIPKWDGGLTASPDGIPSYAKTGQLLNPYSDDEPLFVINGDNFQEYSKQLTEGQKHLFRAYRDSYRMQVYKTRRSAAFPERIYRETIKNAKRAHLKANGNAVGGTVDGIPFPQPKSGREAMWNHILRYYTTGFRGYINHITTNKSGDYQRVRHFFKFIMRWHHPDVSPEEFGNSNKYVMTTTVSPFSKAGNAVLVYLPLNRIKEPAQVRLFNRGQRRVRRLSNAGYDRPYRDSDGLMTQDQIDMFNGPMDRYNWKLLGKKELYVPYNSYSLYSHELDYDTIIRKGHINQSLPRYELHRMWIVEARLKDDASHIYSRRRFYLDEDSWQILMVDMYDTRGEFWRVAESHPVTLYDIPLPVNPVQVHYDLQSRRYVVLNLTNNEKTGIEYNHWEDPERFTPQNLQSFADYPQ